MTANVKVNLFGKNGRREQVIQPRRFTKSLSPEWTALAEGMATEPTEPSEAYQTNTETPATVSEPTTPETPATFSVVHPLGDPNAVRCYRLNRDGTSSRIYAGENAEDLDALCQTHAQISGCVVHLFTATDLRIFKPKPKKSLQSLLAEVDAILAKGREVSNSAKAK